MVSAISEKTPRRNANYASAVSTVCTEEELAATILGRDLKEQLKDTLSHTD
jgi:hypothetical protein